MAKMYGVDIAGYQEGIDIYDLTADFVIVKATEGVQGTIYNPSYRDMLDDALDAIGLVGSYHYANGKDPIAEADCFYDAIRDYKGRIVPCLDWEGQGNRLFQSGDDVEWCLAFMNRISERMGSSCLLYTSKGICNQYDWSEVAERYPLWGAEYAYDDYTWDGYPDDPWQSNHPWGAWGDDVKIHQFGYVCPQPNNGGFDELDGDVFYGTKSDWERMCGGADGDRDDDVRDDDAPSYRDMVVEAVRSQLGERYHSMNYGAAEGFNGWMGTNYVGSGWGCAQLGAFGYNSTIGTDYAGSVWNFAGDCLGDDETNQGGGEFEFTDDPQPGDVVVYLSKGHDGTDAEDYGHLAVYVGDGMVVGSWGVGIPGTSGYWPGRGVSEDAVEEQSLGNGWRYCHSLRLDRMDAERPRPGRSRREVTYQGAGAVYRLYDGSVHFLTASLDEARKASEWMDYEGVAFRVSGSGRDVYRLYDDGNGDHFLTSSKQERDRVRGWMADEGVAFVTSGPVPVYRLCDTSTNVHFYTASVSERDACSAWMRYEGVAFNALSSHESVEYAAHVQSHGWMDPVVDGMVAGTEGESKRLEALLIDPPRGFVIDVMAHVQRVGDMWFRGLAHGNSTVIGTTGKGLRMEGLRIDVKARDNEWVGSKRLVYRAHVQRVGWTDWCDEGSYCGTRGRGLRVEAVQIKLA